MTTLAATAGSADLWTKLTAGATVAAAALVLVQIGREWWHERVRRRTVNARLETIAYHLLRQLRSWLGEPGTGTSAGEDFERWIRDAESGRMLGQHLDRAEERLDQLMALRPDAWRSRGRALDRIHVSFLEGTRLLNEYVDTPRPSGIALYDWMRFRTDAEKDLRDCTTELERHVIAPGTLAIERDLTRLRDSEDPLS